MKRFVERRRNTSSRNQGKRGSQKGRVEKQRRIRDRVRYFHRQAAAAWRKAYASAPTPTPGPAVPEHATGETAAERYGERHGVFVERFGPNGRWLHLAAWWVHNCIAHPLLGVAPGPSTVWLHDRTADWLNLRHHPSHSPPPEVRHRWAWTIHNCVAHPLMGLAPIEPLLSWHETTADDMDEDEWV